MITLAVGLILWVAHLPVMLARLFVHGLAYWWQCRPGGPTWRKHSRAYWEGYDE